MTDARALRQKVVDEVLPGTLRISGDYERGSGSAYSRLSDEQKARLAAADRLVEIEDCLRSAGAALEASQAAFDKTKRSYDATLAVLVPPVKPKTDNVVSIEPKVPA